MLFERNPSMRRVVGWDGLNPEEDKEAALPKMMGTLVTLELKKGTQNMKESFIFLSLQNLRVQIKVH